MSKIVEVWQSIPEELRGAIWMWLAGVAVAAVRHYAQRVPAGPLRSALDAVDLVLHAATASSKRLADRTAPAGKRRSVPPLPVLCLALATSFGCAGSLEQRTRSSLDATLAAAELSYEIASAACDQQTDAARCAAIDDVYLRIADWGEVALRALERGDVKQAEAVYKRMVALLAGLKR